ncbi:hypothetical protein [Thalassomonas haliotis]|uniref:Uncharacterized protein n=1 Tax=Thalassomonas haliotis TaxID=485448 RepID=A0ABY7VCD8_9GAMM|nr:hypothetical protein [Thalassomonas haliotis]WDE11328.1 hypothetical protein H3N35_24420 [Thalassomonas haliotis]
MTIFKQIDDSISLYYKAAEKITKLFFGHTLDIVSSEYNPACARPAIYKRKALD